MLAITASQMNGNTTRVISNAHLTEIALQALEDLNWLLVCQADIPMDLECGEDISMIEVQEQAEQVRLALQKMLSILNH